MSYPPTIYFPLKIRPEAGQKGSSKIASISTGCRFQTDTQSLCTTRALRPYTCIETTGENDSKPFTERVLQALVSQSATISLSETFAITLEWEKILKVRLAGQVRVIKAKAFLVCLARGSKSRRVAVESPISSSSPYGCTSFIFQTGQAQQMSQASPSQLCTYGLYQSTELPSGTLNLKTCLSVKPIRQLRCAKSERMPLLGCRKRRREGGEWELR